MTPLQESQARALEIFKRSYLARHFDLRLSALLQHDPISRFVHLSLGQEMASVIVAMAMRPEDKIALTYRNHAMLLARGADPSRLLAEILGRKAGYSTGLGGSMHLVAPECGSVDASAIVGGNLPIAVGSAVASRLLNDNSVTVCVFGDGAVAQGSFHESLNIAALWKLPVLFVCENNGRAMSSTYDSYSPISTVRRRAIAYGIPGVFGDTSDWDNASRIVRNAIDRARSGNGPSLLEFRTPLLSGHHAGAAVPDHSDPDPMANLIGYLETWGLHGAMNDIVDQVEVRIETAFQFATSSPYPDTSTLIDGPSGL